MANEKNEQNEHSPENGSKPISLTGRTPSSSLMRQLSDIVTDLWGSLTPDQQAARPAGNAAPLLNAANKPPAPVAKPAASLVKKEEKKPELPPFEAMWKLADETVDWTDALVHEEPTDGTSRRLWHFWHEHARQVLDGDTEAYAEVLKTANPLSDLQPYAKSIDAVIDSADSVTATFVAPDPVPAETERYFSGMALRIARDLFALLPIREATVVGMREDREAVRVTFKRGELRRGNFAFLDPAAFVRERGGFKSAEG